MRENRHVAQSLMDRYNRVHRYLRISLTDRCNFRCQYCMPADGIDFEPNKSLLKTDEVLRLARVFAEAGINKVRLTGGEPTLRKDIESILLGLSQIKGIETLAMTTNGSTLSRKAEAYQRAGLSVLNVSIDSLNPDRFTSITRRDQFQLVWDGLMTALEAGYAEVKVNVVVMKGVNHGEICDFVDLTRALPLTVRFIEFMPFVGNRWSEASLYPYDQIREDIERHHHLQPIVTDPSAVGKDFRVPGFAGKVGFVTSMTKSFCSTCDRVRLTADGSIKPCLFSPAEVSLRDMMRNGATNEDLSAEIRRAMLRKPKEHLPMKQLSTVQPRSMIQIGG